MSYAMKVASSKRHTNRHTTHVTTTRKKNTRPAAPKSTTPTSTSTSLLDGLQKKWYTQKKFIAHTHTQAHSRTHTHTQHVQKTNQRKLIEREQRPHKERREGERRVSESTT